MPTFSPFFTVTVKHKVYSYGFKYLKPDIKQYLDQGFALYDNAHCQFTGLSGTDLPAYRDKFTQAIIHNNSAEFHGLKEAYLQDQKAAIHFEQFEVHSKTLQSLVQWQQWSEAASKLAMQNKVKLNWLKTEWLRQAKWAHYSGEALLLAHEFLQEFEYHYQAATEEYARKKDRLPVQLQTHYGDYLQEWGEKIRQEKQSLHFAMLYRLQNATESRDGLSDDVITPMENKLAALDLKLPTTLRHLPELNRVMSGETLVKLYHTLHTQAPGDIKNQANKIKWFTDESPLPLAVIHPKNQPSFMVPKALAGFVPLQAKKPAWLYKSHNQRFYYFKSQQDLWIQLASLPNSHLPKADSLAPLTDPTWQHLVSLQKALQVAYAQAEKARPTGWLARFRHTTTTAFANWQQILFSQQQAILTKQVAYLQQWLPKAKPVQLLLNEMILTQTLADDITNMMQCVDVELQKLISQAPSREALQALTDLQLQFWDIQATINHYIEHDKALAKAIAARRQAVCELYEIINHPETSPEVYTGLIEYYASLPAAEKNNFIQQQASNWQVLQDELNEQLQGALKALKTNRLTEDTLSSTRIINLHRLLTQTRYLTGNLNWSYAQEKLLREYQTYLAQQSPALLQTQAKALNLFEQTLELILASNHQDDFIKVQTWRRGLIAVGNAQDANASYEEVTLPTTDLKTEHVQQTSTGLSCQPIINAQSTLMEPVQASQDNADNIAQCLSENEDLKQTRSAFIQQSSPSTQIMESVAVRSASATCYARYYRPAQIAKTLVEGEKTLHAAQVFLAERKKKELSEEVQATSSANEAPAATPTSPFKIHS